LYATYHFREDSCGIHGWSEIEEYVPKASSLTLDKLDASGKPAFICRDLYFSQAGDDNPRLRARVRINGRDGTSVKKEFGGSFRYGPPGASHTFDSYFPADQYLATKPEYFSLLNGKRVGGQFKGQLCLTNAELKQEFIKKLLANIEKGQADAKNAGLPPPQAYEVSMNDNRCRCECDNCKAEEEKFNPSGLYINFLNDLAAAVKEKYPHVFISTLAYFYNEPPPKGDLKAADNLIIRLCDTQSNQAASILEPCNKVYLDILSQWKKHARHLFIWDYAIVFGDSVTGLPFASEWHYGDLFRTYLENNVSGIFWEHEYPHKCDMYELKFFLEAKLMENPYLDDKKLIDTFLKCYYGPAAPFIKEYRLKLDEIRKERNGVVKWFPSIVSFNYITDDDLLAFEALFDKAESTVKDDSRLFARVRHARCGLDRLVCIRKGRGWFYHGPEQAMDSRFDVKAAAARLTESWPAWAAQFPGKYNLKKSVTEMVAKFDNSLTMLPPPEEFKDRNFYDFYPKSFENYRNAAKLIEDPTSPVGLALQVQSDTSDYYKLPFALGYHDQGKEKTLTSKSYDKPLKKGYAWYSGGKVRIPEHGTIYVTRSWYVSQSTTSIASLKGNEYEIFVSAKFTGPLYWPDEKGPSHIYIDRIILVEP
ncbi:MAG: DUF4838 domain-containing protein, partial [Victivallales bacterium]|nr:DUF4838 domain-containing protein [Victivallales bacterium]